MVWGAGHPPPFVSGSTSGMGSPRARMRYGRGRVNGVYCNPFNCPNVFRRTYCPERPYKFSLSEGQHVRASGARAINPQIYHYNRKCKHTHTHPELTVQFPPIHTSSKYVTYASIHSWFFTALFNVLAVQKFDARCSKFFPKLISLLLLIQMTDIANGSFICVHMM